MTTPNFWEGRVSLRFRDFKFNIYHFQEAFESTSKSEVWISSIQISVTLLRILSLNLPSAYSYQLMFIFGNFNTISMEVAKN